MVILQILVQCIHDCNIHAHSTQAKWIGSLYSMAKNQGREIFQPRPLDLILMRLPVSREKSTAAQRDGVRSASSLDKTLQKIQQIVQVQVYTFSFLLPPDIF